MKGENSNGQAMIQGIKSCIHRANNSGLNKKRIKLITYEDINTAEQARQVASEIIERDNALIVLGHYYSNSSLAAGKLYKQAQIPALTASATADAVVKDNNWYFRTISNNSIQGAFIAHYINKVLKTTVVNIIYDMDSYGQNLMESFVKTTKKLGVKTRKWGFSVSEFDTKVDTIVSELREVDISGTVFIATHSPEGAKLVSLLKYPGAKFTIIGPDSFCSKTFMDTIKKESIQECAESGYHSEGIYVISPFIIDVANQEAQIFRKEFKEQFKEEPTWINAYYHDAMLTILHAINNCNIGGKDNIQKDRKTIRDYLSSINHYDNSIKGITGRIFFDKNGENKRPFAVGIYRNQKVTSAFIQYQPFKETGNATSVLSDMLTGKIIKIDDMYMCQTRVVYTGIDINDVIELDLQSQSYIIDFYLWFRHQSDFNEASNVRFVNPVGSLYIDKELSVKDKTALSQILYKSEEGITTEAYHITARFRNSFDFHTYPFEKHKLKIKFRHNTMTRNKLIYVSDILGMNNFFDQASNSKKVYTALNAWSVKSLMFYQNIITNDSTLGYSKYFKSQNHVEYSEFNTDINIKRKVFSFLFKNVFLIIVLFIILNFIYLIPHDHFAIKVSISMSTLLTTSLCHTKLASNLNVGYLLSIEYAFFAVYAISAVTILLSIWLFNLSQLSEVVDISEEERELYTKKIIKVKRLGIVLHLLISLSAGLFLWHLS